MLDKGKRVKRSPGTAEVKHSDHLANEILDLWNFEAPVHCRARSGKSEMTGQNEIASYYIM